MAANKDILKGAMDHMVAFVTSLPIAWPGVNFTPPSDGMWFELSLFPNEPDDLTYDDDDAITLGFVQVLVNDQAGNGIIGLIDEAENIIAHFPKGTDFGQVQVRKKPYMSPPVTDGNRIFIPVTIPYYGIV